MAQDKELSQIRGPFRVYPKKKKEEPISTMDEYKQEFIRSLEAYDVRQKKRRSTDAGKQKYQFIRRKKARRRRCAGLPRETRGSHQQAAGRRNPAQHKAP